VEVGAAAYVTTAAGTDEVELEVDEVELEDDVELEAVEAGTVVTPAGSFAAKSRPLS
jgi:hypothetical protein